MFNTTIDFLLSSLSYVWNLFLDWLYIFISPKDNFQVLWILIPIWLAWFFGEFFQEKKGTNFGNAITNGVVPFWVALDWCRLLVTRIQQGTLTIDSDTLFKFSICTLIFIYGITILIQGIRGRMFVRYIARIRQITYVMLVFTPVIYGLIPLSLGFLVTIIVFFPLYYYIIEWLDHMVPNPKIFDLDEGKPAQSEMQDIYKFR